MLKHCVSLLKWTKDQIDSLFSSLDTWQVVVVSATSSIVVYKIVSSIEFNELKTQGFRLLIRMPVISSIATKKLDSIGETIDETCQKVFEGEQFIVKLPDDGFSTNEVLEKVNYYMEKLGKVNWKQGKASGTVYTDMNGDLMKMLTEVYSLTAYTNPLHPDVFPGIQKMEAELVRWICSLFKGDEQSCGVMTSGGTESILLACKAYRDYGLAKKNIKYSEIVAPITIHAAFGKAAQLFGMKIKYISVDKYTYKVNLNEFKSAITRNTVLLVGSACNFPHGIIDDIELIAKLGLKYDIPVHADCCLGGFLLPFIERTEFSNEIPRVDFQIDGLTSISCDTHKYGYSPKGSSLIIYKSPVFRRFQYSVETEWPGGIYASPTLAGSRAGSCIASTWSTLIHYGFNGYVEATKKILQTQRWIKRELQKINGIEVIGDPMMSVIAFKSSLFNIYQLSDELTKIGWSINPLQFPPAIHICVTLMHTQDGVPQKFINDVKLVVNQIKVDGKKYDDQRMGAVYGAAQRMPDRSVVKQFAAQFLDGCYYTKAP